MRDNLNVETNESNKKLDARSLTVEIPFWRRKNDDDVEKEQDAQLSKIIAAHCVSLCGNVNYNKYGVKSGRSFRLYCDNFIEYVYASKNRIKNGRYRHASTAIREISSILLENGLGKCVNKCTGLGKEKYPKNPYTYLDRGADSIKQNFKVTTADLDLNVVLRFLESDVLHNAGMFLNDVDIAIDFAGSFDRDEVCNLPFA